MEIYIEKTISIVFILISLAVTLFGSWLIRAGTNKDSDDEAKKNSEVIGYFRYKYILFAGEVVFTFFGIVFLIGGFYCVGITSRIMWDLFL